jgi:glycosyltransferase involved in cell wall biosynthesis
MRGSVLAYEDLHRQERQAVPRPKLLFLAYYFPPLNSSACVRTWNIAKYLSRCGWDVTIVTPDPSLWRKTNSSSQVDAELDRERIRRLCTGHRWRCLSPWDLKCWDGHAGRLFGGLCRVVARRLGLDMLAGWANEVEIGCGGLSRKDVDVILASGPPFVSFRLAKSLSERLGCPYVLDYRDPWTVRRRSNASGKGIPAEERGIVEGSSAVTVISPSLLSGRVSPGPKLHVITNGYDPEELARVQPHRFGHFAIVYTGNFYFPIRVITPVMQAIKHLKKDEQGGHAEWKFHYYGVHGEHVCQEAERFGVMDKVVVHGKVTRDEALSAVRGAGVAVVVTALQAEVPGKLFEALGLRVPVLVVGPTGSDLDVIALTAGLVRKCTAGDIEGMTTFIQEVMSGQIPAAKRPDAYAWPTLITDLETVLRKTLRPDPCAR